MVIWTAVHISAHMSNFAYLAMSDPDAKTTGQRIVAFLSANFLTGPGATGWIMTLSLAIMVFFAMEKRRRAHFERFWYSHHLFIVFFITWQLHGMFCMIKPDRPPYCSYNNIGVFWVSRFEKERPGPRVLTYVFSDIGLWVESSGFMNGFSVKFALVISHIYPKLSSIPRTSWNYKLRRRRSRRVLVNTSSYRVPKFLISNGIPSLLRGRHILKQLRSVLKGSRQCTRGGLSLSPYPSCGRFHPSPRQSCGM